MELLPRIRNGALVYKKQKPPKTPRRIACWVLLERKAKRKRRSAKKLGKPKPFVRPTYRDYITSPQWQKRRQSYYKRNKKECVACKSAYRVGLHHLTYKNLGRENDEDLVPLCWGCHATYHEQHGVKGETVHTHIFIEQESQAVALYNMAKHF